MRASPSALCRALLAVTVLGALLPSAKAEVVFSFSGAVLTDNVPNEPALTVSGSFTLPGLNPGLIQAVTPPDPVPVAVDLTVFNGSAVIASFTNPYLLTYGTGYSDQPPNTDYAVNLLSTGTSSFIGITIVNDDFVEVDFAGGDLPGGYSFDGDGSSISLAEVLIPEPPAMPLFLSGLAVIAVFRSQRRRSAR